MTRYEAEAERLFDEYRGGTQVGERFVRIIAAALQAEADRVMQRDIEAVRANLYQKPVADHLANCIRNAAEKEKAE